MAATAIDMEYESARQALDRAVADRREASRRLRSVTPVPSALRGDSVLRSRATRSVLVVDDNADYRAMLVGTLSASLGVPIYSAGTVAEAEASISDHQPAVVVLDWYLGNVTAERFLAELHRDIGVVLLTGADDATVARVIRRYKIPARQKGNDSDVVALVKEELDDAMA